MNFLRDDFLSDLNRYVEKDFKYTEDFIEFFLKILKKYSGIHSLGARLKDGDDYPYYFVMGFADNFVKAENYLCSRDKMGKKILDENGDPCLACMCGSIIKGDIDPSKPFFTKYGSFWSNCTSKLLSSTCEDDRGGKTRNTCNSSGYESVALIPIKYMDEVYGLLQLNDFKEGFFDLEFIEFIEGVAERVAEVISHLKLKDERRKAQREILKRSVLDIQRILQKNLWRNVPEQ